MSEKPPKILQTPAPAAEREPAPTKAEVIAALAAHPEDFSLLNRYLDAREAEGKTSADTLALNIETALMYRDAGLTEAARETLQDAADQAFQAREDEIYYKAIEEIELLANVPLQS